MMRILTKGIATEKESIEKLITDIGTLRTDVATLKESEAKYKETSSKQEELIEHLKLRKKDLATKLKLVTSQVDTAFEKLADKQALIEKIKTELAKELEQTHSVEAVPTVNGIPPAPPPPPGPPANAASNPRSTAKTKHRSRKNVLQ